MTYYFPRPGNCPPNSNFLVGNNFQLHLEIEKLRSENNNLKNTINHQVNQIQQQVNFERKFVNLKNDLINMNSDFKENFDKKIKEIKHEQQMGIKLITEIWRLHMYMAIVNLQKPLNDEKFTQTDFEIDDDDDDDDEDDDDQSSNNSTTIINDNQEQIVPYSEQISNDEYHQTEMETQTVDMSNNIHDPPGVFHDYHQSEMETQFEDISNNCHRQAENVKNQFLLTRMETQPVENLKNHLYQQSNGISITNDCLTSPITPRLQGNSNDYCQTQVTVTQNIFSNLSSTFPQMEETRKNSIFNDDLKNPKRERLMLTMYACEQCDRRYVSKQKLKRHKKMLHEMKQCHHCQKSFKLGYINRHQKFYCKEALNFFSYEKSFTR